MSEDQELLARISHVAGKPQMTSQLASLSFSSMKGQINRHKNQQQPKPPSSHHQNGVYRHQHYSRGRARGRPPFGYGHRHPSIVLNRTNSDSGEGTCTPDENRSDADHGTWVSKRGRHLQLINSNVYQDETELRSRSHSQPSDAATGQGAGGGHDTNNSPMPETPRTKPATPSGHHLEVNGLTFEVCDAGRTLVRITGSAASRSNSHVLIQRPDSDTASTSTPEKAVISNIPFYRTADGNLERSGTLRPRCVMTSPSDPVELTTVSLVAPEKNQSLCKRFSNTGIIHPFLSFCITLLYPFFLCRHAYIA
jgi:hypothetical protein